MEIAVFSLGDQLWYKIVRKVTIHTRCHTVMASLLPRIELGLHDVAIHASFWVLAKVG